MATTTRNLTKAKATAAYKAMLKLYRAHEVTEHPVVAQDGQRWPDGPVLCQDFQGWHTTTRWAIVWEGGPFEWALDIAGEHADKFPAGVFVEPVNGWALGLYPA